jgi:hypothetical protein
VGTAQRKTDAGPTCGRMQEGGEFGLL